MQKKNCRPLIYSVDTISETCSKNLCIKSALAKL